jgi:hypothetical protein
VVPLRQTRAGSQEVPMKLAAGAEDMVSSPQASAGGPEREGSPERGGPPLDTGDAARPGVSRSTTAGASDEGVAPAAAERGSAAAQPAEPLVPWPPKAPPDLPREIAKNWTKAAEQAKPVLEKALAAEPALTGSIEQNTEDLGGKMIGLEYRLKSAESLTRKIATDMANEGLTEAQAAGRIADSVRYTSCFPPEKLVQGTQSTLARLQAEGNTILKLKNTWLDSESSYKGINVQMQTPDGQVFELQFHTPESFWAKDEGTHAIFEKMRQVSKGSPEWNELNEQQMEIARKLQVPDDIDKIQPIKKAP